LNGEEDYWLPPIEVDPPEKLKPRRLTPDEYDEMHTALTALYKWAEKVGPDKVREIIGAIDVAPENQETVLENTTRPPIYRTLPNGDTWKCHDCKDRGDKWYMQEHRCSRSKVQKLSWFRIKRGQRKAARIKKLQGENEKIV
jgi:hypothetical protein